MKVGVAGRGRMGRAMAKQLLGVGHEVIVRNRTPGKADARVRSAARREDARYLRAGQPRGLGQQRLCEATGFLVEPPFILI